MIAFMLSRCWKRGLFHKSRIKSYDMLRRRWKTSYSSSVPSEDDLSHATTATKILYNKNINHNFKKSMHFYIKNNKKVYKDLFF